jgi:hypothetical protein
MGSNSELLQQADEAIAYLHKAHPDWDFEIYNDNQGGLCLRIYSEDSARLENHPFGGLKYVCFGRTIEDVLQQWLNNGNEEFKRIQQTKEMGK